MLESFARSTGLPAEEAASRISSSPPVGFRVCVHQHGASRVGKVRCKPRPAAWREASTAALLERRVTERLPWAEEVLVTRAALDDNQQRLVDLQSQVRGTVAGEWRGGEEGRVVST